MAPSGLRLYETALAAAEKEAEGRPGVSLKAEALLKVGNSKHSAWGGFLLQEEVVQAHCSLPLPPGTTAYLASNSVVHGQGALIAGGRLASRDPQDQVVAAQGFPGFSCSLLQLPRTGAREVCHPSQNCLQAIGSFTKLVHNVAASTSLERSQVGCGRFGPTLAPAMSTCPR